MTLSVRAELPGVWPEAGAFRFAADEAADEPSQANAPFSVRDRLTGQEVPLSAADFDDLCRVHLFDWLEQVPRSQEWGYRRAAYRRIAARLGPARLELYDRTYSAAPPTVAPWPPDAAAKTGG